MDGFILESRYEGQGIVILEAKILGLDLIIPDRLKEYIDKQISVVRRQLYSAIGMENTEEKKEGI